MGHDHTGTQKIPNRITSTTTDGPELKLRKLIRYGERDQFGKPRVIVLPNSVRSTLTEAIRLQQDELYRTGIKWEITDA